MSHEWSVVVPKNYSASPDSALALVTERDGESLADTIRHARRRPVPGASRLLAQICEGLAHMHSDGWAHGGLRPGDVTLMADGSVRLADFGLPTELDGTHSDGTCSDRVHGYTPPARRSDYLPPAYWTELLAARGISVPESADIWAFGVIGCQLLTGRLPFPGRTVKARAAAAAGYVSSGVPEPRAGGLSPQGRRLIEDCLAPDRVAHLEVTAPRLVDRLDRLQQERVPIALEVRKPRGGRRPAGRHRRRRPGRI
jgi:serine/threonine protein kinase